MEGNIEQSFDCTGLFPAYDHAYCRIKGNIVHVQLFTETTQFQIEMNIDRIANFLERCRREQQ